MSWKNLLPPSSGSFFLKINAKESSEILVYLSIKLHSAIPRKTIIFVRENMTKFRKEYTFEVF
jgi:hypothetical protein